ncbi:MAG: acyl-CoA dehydrogenase [Azoarcus sp.]|uniref:Acyl-CoA dehydrogenase n=1 Tax=Aromatoleum tolulyticum TaxID=34027 RepID=A0A1N6Q112_9RHOO|nr:acyl-CoA dehydrogenase family protein [Aromatoleum tolulyticum]MCK9987053.1 acyl-CoA dehydrogenase [Azoarcus sp.]SIQ10271.1 acyl-CoA dehydrogenase [Aromatoleum tolulyticum]
MDFDYSEKTEMVLEVLRHFMARRVLPANLKWHQCATRGEYPLAIVEPLKAIAREEGLWNLFLPGLREHEPGTRLDNVEYAPLAEAMGRIPWSAEVFNCSAPDTGNMELLHLHATDAQYERWLRPLLDGRNRSCFAMTEPDVASSDATNIRTTIRRDGDDYVINGRKWFVTGAAHPHCTFAIVMGQTSDGTDTQTQTHCRHSMVIVPMDTPGVEIVRNIPVMHHLSPEGHCEIVFREVRVPAENLLGEEGNGFALAQARLGPGRVHHCMRTIGQCELALEMMCERALERRTFGKYLSDFANIQEWIAHSRVEIDQARLLVLRAAWLMDRRGNQAARVDVSAIKFVAAQLQTRILDRAMQVFGAMGLTPDTPLSLFWTWGRAMRFFDGPDEVHLRVLARSELDKAKANRGATAAYYLLE